MILKIAFVISSCSSGGAEIFVKNLIKELNRKSIGFKYELWVMSRMSDVSPNDNKRLEFENKYLKEIQGNGIKVRFICKRPKKDRLKCIYSIRKLYVAYKPHIIHIHSENATYYFCMALYFKRVSIIQTIHSIKIYHPLIQRYFIDKKVAAYVAISEKVKEVIRIEIGKNLDKIYLIFNGISIEKFTKKRVLNPNVNRIIAIGRLVESKNHKNLLMAFKKLRDLLYIDKIDIPQLLIVGDGVLENDLKALAKELEIDCNVEFLGLRDDIPDLLNKCDIYVMSSDWEGYSISLIEAVVSGISTIATDVGSNNEIIADGINGILVKPRNPQKLAFGLYQLVKNFSLRKNIYGKSIKNIQKFNIQKCVIDHICMYMKILRTEIRIDSTIRNKNE